MRRILKLLIISIFLPVGCSNQPEKPKKSERVEVVEKIDNTQPEIGSAPDAYIKVSMDKAMDMVKVKVAKQFPFPDEVEFPSTKDFIITSNSDNSYTFKATSKFRDSFNQISTAKWEATIVLEGDEDIEADWSLTDFYIE